MTKILDTLFDRTLTGLDRTMDLTWRRNQAIVSNVTNAETPMYRAVDLDFGHELDRAFGAADSTLNKTSPKHLDTASNQAAHLVPDHTGSTKADGNNVDLDIQMGQLASNAGEFMNAARLMKRQLNHIKTAIRSGER